MGARSRNRKIVRRRKLPASEVTNSAPGAPADRRPVPLHVLSDSTGNLAQHMLTAFLTQFPRDAFEMYLYRFVRTELQLERAMDRIATTGGIVFHAFVHREFKEVIEQRCRDIGVAYNDLTGRFVEFLTVASGIQPQPDVRRLHRTSTGYHQRIKALEFTLEHDDGLGLDTIDQADIVLAGVSRTSKTPTSIYLAQQGFRVANVSLAINVPPPQQLLALTERVVGLTINPEQLVEIRTHRNVSWRMGDTSYNDPDYVHREIMWSRRLFRDHGWPILNVTDQAVEETAVRIIDMLGLHIPTHS